MGNKVVIIVSRKYMTEVDYQVTKVSKEQGPTEKVKFTKTKKFDNKLNDHNNDENKG